MVYSLISQNIWERFSNLALPHIHYYMEICSEEVLDHLLLRYLKRVQLKNVLDDMSDDEEQTSSNQI